MVYDISYRNDDVKAHLKNLLGPSYSLFSSIKLKGIGSKRMIIDECSPKLKDYTNNLDNITYGNIELRPKGIIVYINSKLCNYAWPIPYYKLVVYKTNGLSIHADGNFVHFRPNTTYLENKQFINKMLDLKLNFNAKLQRP